MPLQPDHERFTISCPGCDGSPKVKEMNTDSTEMNFRIVYRAKIAYPDK